MNELKNYISNQTPIEIALGIDENGMTTARKLYEFLELNPSNYSKWYKANITENEFATENEDYFYSSSSTSEQGRGNFAQDFKLIAHFAKKLSMKGSGERAEEAREYFTHVEEKVKELAVDRKTLSPELQMFMQMGEVMARQELEQKRQAEKIHKIENNQKAIVQTFLKPEEPDFKAWVKKCISAIAESDNYHYVGSSGARYGSVWNESYDRLNSIRACRLKQRVEQRRERALIAGADRKQVEQITKLSIVEEDKDLRPIYERVIKEMMIAYCVEVA
jgi:anti-repressor protein